MVGLLQSVQNTIIEHILTLLLQPLRWEKTITSTLRHIVQNLSNFSVEITKFGFHFSIFSFSEVKNFAQIGTKVPVDLRHHGNP